MILTAIEIRKQLLKTGQPAGSHLMATNSFSWQDLMCGQTEIPCLAVLENLLKVAQILQVYRDKIFKCQIKITSGWRSENYNAKIGGAAKSTHVLGLALDFTPLKFWTIPQVYDLMDRLHFGGVERTDGNWQHIDLRMQNIRFSRQNVILANHFNIVEHDKLFKKVKNG